MQYKQQRETCQLSTAWIQLSTIHRKSSTYAVV